MNTPVIIDIVVAAVLLGFAAWGAHRGLFRTAAGLVIVVAALVGAGIVANTLTPMASMALQPVIEKHVESRIDKALSGEGSVRAQEPSLNREKQDAGSMSWTICWTCWASTQTLRSISRRRPKSRCGTPARTS